MNSFRNTDMKAEAALASFMDSSLYKKLIDTDGHRAKFERVVDHTTQLNGVDVIIEYEGKKHLIDEKASIYYSNVMIPTFAFEVDSIQKNHSTPVPGWFVNDSLATEYYMLIWPNLKCVRNSSSNEWERISLDSITPNDFTIVEAMLIKKEKILSFLNEYDWSKNRIISYAKKIRESSNLSDKITIPETDKFYFFYTTSLAEKPINVVIKKSELQKLAEKCFFISADSYSVINNEEVSKEINDYNNEREKTEIDQPSLDEISEEFWDNLFDQANQYIDYDDQYTPVEMMNHATLVSNRDFSSDSPEEVLKEFFGYDSFRFGQKDIITNILSHRDCFAVMPTGAGKSVCYQVPAMMLEGITLVISPLISLMQDQVNALLQSGIPAAYINSMLSESAYFETLDNARKGKYKIIYVAPERLITEGFINFAINVNISMITVDEAHCISQWGQDFRPSYQKIVEFIHNIKQRPIISAFTATATENVREDIICSLGLNNPYIIVTGFNRSNLFFQVDKPKDKTQYVIEYVKSHRNESGIIYCATRKNVDKLYEKLAIKGYSVGKYHAGMSISERKKMQDDFVYDDVSVIVATNAFGMGIDKSNVRFVIHYNMPQSMENYYQEAGRAGRDGLSAKCILLFSGQDVVINKFLLSHKDLSAIDYYDRETIRLRDNERLMSMERYCYTSECLRNYILTYFGETPLVPCEYCGNCLNEYESLDVTNEAKSILNCVYEAKGRYGKTIIIDIVFGANTTRIREIGATQYKTYGVLKNSNKKILLRVINQLLYEDYLFETEEYSVLKIGNIEKLLNNQKKVVIKVTKDDKSQDKSSFRDNIDNDINLTPLGYDVLDKLKSLRREIAREEGMPPYIIFSDKSLIEMAYYIPLTQSEMLEISGVGKKKLTKYGDRFILLISDLTAEFPELLKDKQLNKVVATPKDESKKEKNKGKKPEFYLTKKQAEEYDYSESRNVYQIRDEMNRIGDLSCVKKIPGTRILMFLREIGYIHEVNINGYNRDIPTESGSEIGITVQEQVSERGYKYPAIICPVKLQKIIVNNFIDTDENQNPIISNVSEQKKKDTTETYQEWLTRRREIVANSHMPWSDEENSQIIHEYTDKNLTIQEISSIHGRSPDAIRSRLKKLGLIKF